MAQSFSPPFHEHVLVGGKSYGDDCFTGTNPPHIDANSFKIMHRYDIVHDQCVTFCSASLFHIAIAIIDEVVARCRNRAFFMEKM